MNEEFFQWGFLKPLRDLGIMDDLGLIIIAICFGITVYRALKATKERNEAKKEAEKLKAEGLETLDSEDN